MKPIEALTCTEAWVTASKHLLQMPGRRDYNIVLEIADPITVTPRDLKVISRVDRFLRSKDGLPVCTVANTIFPLSYYQHEGAEGIFESYPAAHDTLKKHPDAYWGPYAIRMLRRIGPDGEVIKPLETLVTKLKRELTGAGPKRAIYELNVIDPLLELPIYDPEKDATRVLGGPCLSHVSFKLTSDRRLILTALYRSHYYVQRALGNLIGLAQLQCFVARESGLSAGPLVCLSTMAVLETNFGKPAVEALVNECAEMLSDNSTRMLPVDS